MAKTHKCEWFQHLSNAADQFPDALQNYKDIQTPGWVVDNAYVIHYCRNKEKAYLMIEGSDNHSVWQSGDEDTLSIETLDRALMYLEVEFGI